MNDAADTLKLADVGVARMVDTTSQLASATSRGVGTLLYQAPEQHQMQPLTVKVDVFAYGVLLNELESGVRPWQDVLQDLELNQPSIDSGLAVRSRVCAGDRPPVHRETRFAALIAACWSPDAELRPSMREVHGALGDAAASGHECDATSYAGAGDHQQAFVSDLGTSSGSSLGLPPLAKRAREMSERAP